MIVIGISDDGTGKFCPYKLGIARMKWTGAVYSTISKTEA